MLALRDTFKRKPIVNPSNSGGMTRRSVLKAGAYSAGAMALPKFAQAQDQSAGAASQSAEPTTSAAQALNTSVSLKVNGQSHTAEVDVRTTLLDLLRENLELSGTKKGCDHGQCGACTILLDGKRVNACLTLAVMHQGAEITTVEGLGQPDALHPLQASFVKHDAFQCGYCTPGQICSAVGALDEIKRGVPSHVSADLTAQPLLSVDEIRERMSGNLCRCGAYSNIVDAVTEVAGGQA